MTNAFNFLRDLWKSEDDETDGENGDYYASDGAGAPDPTHEADDQESTPEQNHQRGPRPEDTNVGWFGISNSLSDQLASECLPTARDRFGVEIPVQKVEDVNMGRNPLRVEDVAPMMGGPMEEAFLRQSYDSDYALVPSSQGTGFIQYKMVDVDLIFEGTIDVIVPSHKISHTTLYRNPQDAILAGICSAMLDAPAICIDHRAEEIGFDNVQWELAKILGALTLTDVANRSYGFWTLAIDTIPLGGRSEMDLNPPVQRALGEQSPWATASQWAPWAVKQDEIDPDSTIPTLADPDRLAILPHGVDLGQHTDLEVIHAHVNHAHVLSFWPLDPEWIREHVQRQGAAYVNNEIRDRESPLRQVWEAHTERFGGDDPVARWEEFYTEHVEPSLPD